MYTIVRSTPLQSGQSGTTPYDLRKFIILYQLSMHLHLLCDVWPAFHLCTHHYDAAMQQSSYMYWSCVATSSSPPHTHAHTRTPLPNTNIVNLPSPHLAQLRYVDETGERLTVAPADLNNVQSIVVDPATHTPIITHPYMYMYMYMYTYMYMYNILCYTILYKCRLKILSFCLMQGLTMCVYQLLQIR